MKSQIIVALVVLVAVAAHIALYLWVKFKIHEGVILQFLIPTGMASLAFLLSDYIRALSVGDAENRIVCPHDRVRPVVG
jgi:small-conductance mechanosensitive channel